MCNFFRLLVLRDLGVLFAIGNVGAITTVEYLNAVAKVGDVFLGLRLEFCGVQLEGLFNRNVVRVERFNADE